MMSRLKSISHWDAGAASVEMVGDGSASDD